MGVQGILMGEFTALFTGMDGRVLTPAEMSRLIGVAARNLQKRVARSFAQQKTMGSSYLLPNKPEYDARKRKEGHDPRRGHRTNHLQHVLDSSVRLYQIRIEPQGDFMMAARVTMEERMLHSLVPYAEYLEEKKVRTGGILSLAALWVREEALKINAKQEAERLKSRRLDRSGQDVVRKGMLGQRASALRLLNTIANKGAIRGPIRRR